MYRSILMHLLWVIATASYAQQVTYFDTPEGKLQIRRLADQVNTRQSEFAPFRYGDKIYYSSTTQKDNNSAGVSRIFASINEGVPTLVLDVNSKKENLHAANVTMMPDASVVYYTLCKEGVSPEQLDCTIWSRQREYEGHWSAASRLPQHINLRKYGATQPSVGFDMALKQFVLYFVSNRPGGKGGLDIWAAPIRFDGSFEEPFNLPCNTSGDDITPFFHQQSQTLFF